MDIEADYLIIGSGIAGLFFALKAARCGSVAVVTKRERRESNTQYAQGGIAAAMDAADSFESHVRDTLSAGDGLCDRAVVEAVVAERRVPHQPRRELVVSGDVDPMQGFGSAFPCPRHALDGLDKTLDHALRRVRLLWSFSGPRPLDLVQDNLAQCRGRTLWVALDINAGVVGISAD